MSVAERVRRHRALKALKAAADDAELRAFVQAGLDGTDKEARQEVVAFLAELPREIEALRRDVDEIRRKR